MAAASDHEMARLIVHESGRWWLVMGAHDIDCRGGKRVDRD